MYFEHVGTDSRVIVFTIDAEDDDDIKDLPIDCGFTLSPLGTAELIVYNDDSTRIVFDAVTGMLPNYTTLVAIKDSDCAFPDGESHDIRIVFDPYTPQDSPRIDRITVTLVTDPCPICGLTAAEKEAKGEVKAVETDNEDEDEDQEIKPFNRLDFHFNNED